MSLAHLLQQQAARYRELRASQIRVHVMYVISGQVIASDLDGGPRDYGMGSSALAAIEDLETKHQERQ